MGHHLKNLFLFAIAGTVSLQAQRTWKDLRFGMTPAQLRSVFPELSKASNDHQLSNCSMSYEARSLAIQRFRFTPEFCFDVPQNPRLTGIVLAADLPSSKPSMRFDAELLLQSLTEKYGKPVIYNGDCEETKLQGSDGFCDSTWRAPGQSITAATFWTENKTTILMVSFQKLSDSL